MTPVRCKIFGLFEKVCDVHVDRSLGGARAYTGVRFLCLIIFSSCIPSTVFFSRSTPGTRGVASAQSSLRSVYVLSRRCLNLLHCWPALTGSFLLSAPAHLPSTFCYSHLAGESASVAAGQCFGGRVEFDQSLVRPRISLKAPSTVEELRRVVQVLRVPIFMLHWHSFGSPPRWCNVKTGCWGGTPVKIS